MVVYLIENITKIWNWVKKKKKKKPQRNRFTYLGNISCIEHLQDRSCRSHTSRHREWHAGKVPPVLWASTLEDLSWNFVSRTNTRPARLGHHRRSSYLCGCGPNPLRGGWSTSKLCTSCCRMQLDVKRYFYNFSCPLDMEMQACINYRFAFDHDGVSVVVNLPTFWREDPSCSYNHDQIHAYCKVLAWSICNVHPNWTAALL
jgi:hypothetical protein